MIAAKGAVARLVLLGAPGVGKGTQAGGIPEREIIERLAGRRSCGSCGAVYHVRHNPPKREGLCDRCGSQLTQRPDDKESVIEERLREYRRQTAPLIERYRKTGLLLAIDGRGRRG